MKKFSMLALFVTFYVNSTWGAYTRPVPDLPKLQDPLKATDVISYNLIVQIHGTLFSLNSSNLPVPNVVESFEVSPDQKKYTFTLRALSFHDETPLSVVHVKNSIERALATEGSSYQKILQIAEIKAGANARQIVFTLKRPDPRFIFKLADSRLSILKTETEFFVGLGPYRFDKASDDSLLLRKVSKYWKDISAAPAQVKFHRTTLPKALSGFKEGRYQDLFLFPVNSKTAHSFASRAHVSEILFPRTYALFLNARKLNLEQRLDITRSFKPDLLRKKCYPDSTKAVSLIPPGYMGHLTSAAALKNEITVPKPERLKIAIPAGLDADDCVKRVMNAQLINYPNLEIKIQELGTVIDRWVQNDLDGYFAYIEGESDSTFFEHFLPDSNFPLGLTEASPITELISKYNAAAEMSAAAHIAQEIGRSMENMRTFIPVLYPKVYLVLQNQFVPVQAGLRAAYLIPFTEFRENKK